MKTFYARGAYGRSAKEADWKAGKDFQCLAYGQYFSVRDTEYLRKQGYEDIAFLDNHARRVFTVSLDNA